ncbi:MAG: hypothetical protein SFY66_01995 [Oculatellaceae cyanobacterium bins.114]|nr:hypothetical protein [Oculatellaceae cyanobacterium bins.114]
MDSDQLMERGLLDLSVTLSTRDITAGNQFALFVLVKNPFDKPVWIRQVHVSLPSELKLATSEGLHTKKASNKDKQRPIESAQEEKQIKLEAKIDLLQKELTRALEEVDKGNGGTESTQRFVTKIKGTIYDLQEELKALKHRGQTHVHVEGTNIGNFRIISDQNQTHLHFGGSQSNPINIGVLEIYDQGAFQETVARSRTIELESSLPRNTALQPGSTVVYTAVLYVERSLIFTPSQYRLQFNVNYCFHAKAPTPALSEEVDIGEEGVFTNTIAHEISIRPSVYSVLTGAVLGGLIGAVARLLQVTPVETFQGVTYIDGFRALVSIILAVILSGIAIIFMARKSDTQSFVSVEDFWGGLLIGFLVGYTGASFFEQLTGITNPTSDSPAPPVSPSLLPNR